jgi:hypothetical protein
MLLNLDFLQFQPYLKLSKEEDVTYVFDPIRRKKYILTPEELLRQLVLLYLLEIKKYPAKRIRVEMGITVNDRKKRCDIIVFDQNLQPWLLVECKSPKIALSQATFEQAAIYNMKLQVPFLSITNGMATYACSIDYEGKEFAFLEGLPDVVA